MPDKLGKGRLKVQGWKLKVMLRPLRYETCAVEDPDHGCRIAEESGSAVEVHQTSLAS